MNYYYYLKYVCKIGFMQNFKIIIYEMYRMKLTIYIYIWDFLF